MSGIQIIWLADYTTKEHQGGAQQTNQVMVDYGIKRGHRIEYMTPLGFSSKKIDKADLVITNNIVKFGPYQINWVINNSTYIRYEHDYDATKLIKNFPQLWEKSKLNIFLSPLHKKETERIFGKKVEGKIIPSPIIGFEDRGEKREGVLWAGNIVPEKGVSNVIRYIKQNPDTKLTVAGFGKEPELSGAKFIGEVPHHEMINQYNLHETFIHLPLWKEPFGRTIVEAYLCGCNLIVNNNCGVMSYGWDWSDYDAIKNNVTNSPRLFWESVEKCMK